MSRLVLSRRQGEGFVLHYPGGPVVYFGVARARDDHGKVRVFIDAPPTVAIHREELVLDTLEERLAQVPLVALSADDIEAVRECRWLMDSARAIQRGDSKRKPVAQRLLDRLAGMGVLRSTPGAPGAPGVAKPPRAAGSATSRQRSAPAHAPGG